MGFGFNCNDYIKDTTLDYNYFKDLISQYHFNKINQNNSKNHAYWYYFIYQKWCESNTI